MRDPIHIIFALNLLLTAHAQEAQSPGDALRSSLIEFSVYRFESMNPEDGMAHFRSVAQTKPGFPVTLALNAGMFLSEDQDYLLVLNSHSWKLAKLPLIEVPIFPYDPGLERLLQHLQAQEHTRDYHRIISKFIDTSRPAQTHLALVELATAHHDRRAQIWLPSLDNLWGDLAPSTKSILVKVANRYPKACPFNKTLTEARHILQNEAKTLITTAGVAAMDIVYRLGSPALDWPLLKYFFTNDTYYIGPALHFALLMDHTKTIQEVNRLLQTSLDDEKKAILLRWKRIEAP